MLDALHAAWQHPPMTHDFRFRMNDALWRGVPSCLAQVAKRPYRAITGRIAG
jgi:hypothetical protein